MTSFAQLERDRVLQQRARDDLDNQILKCDSCGNSWFEQVEAAQFSANHYAVIGQKLPELKGRPAFILLRCLRCNEYTEPSVGRSVRDAADRIYDQFLDEVQGEVEEADSNPSLKGERV